VADFPPDEVLDWIGAGAADVTADEYWTLDPIDGTKGFLRGDQYAVALDLVEAGEVVAGVLGGPNLPNDDGSAGALFVGARLANNRGVVASSVAFHAEVRDAMARVLT